MFESDEDEDSPPPLEDMDTDTSGSESDSGSGSEDSAPADALDGIDDEIDADQEDKCDPKVCPDKCDPKICLIMRTNCVFTSPCTLIVFWQLGDDSWIGRTVRKFPPGFGYFLGKVTDVEVQNEKNGQRHSLLSTRTVTPSTFDRVTCNLF